MKFNLKKRANRAIYQNAKWAFTETVNKDHPDWYGKTYWEEFGKAHNLHVNITSWRGPFPVIESLEFKSKEDYVWFMLRYS